MSEEKESRYTSGNSRRRILDSGNRNNSSPGSNWKGTTRASHSRNSAPRFAGSARDNIFTGQNSKSRSHGQRIYSKTAIAISGFLLYLALVITIIHLMARGIG